MVELAMLYVPPALIGIGLVTRELKTPDALIFGAMWMLAFGLATYLPGAPAVAGLTGATVLGIALSFRVFGRGRGQSGKD